MNNKNLKKIRTVNLNERGQIVIPEDIRKDFGIKGSMTMVLIEREDEIALKMESDVLDSIESGNNFWKKLQKESMKNAWSREDVIWEKIYEGVNK